MERGKNVEICTRKFCKYVLVMNFEKFYKPPNPHYEFIFFTHVYQNIFNSVIETETE